MSISNWSAESRSLNIMQRNCLSFRCYNNKPIKLYFHRVWYDFKGDVNEFLLHILFKLKLYKNTERSTEIRLYGIHILVFSLLLKNTFVESFSIFVSY